MPGRSAACERFQYSSKGGGKVLVQQMKQHPCRSLQIRSVATERLTKKLGRVSSAIMEEIAAVIEYQ